MNIEKEYGNRDLVSGILDRIREISAELPDAPAVTVMEVCGGHTMAIHKNGIPSLLPENIKLISGPGCPVCVTDTEYIDRAIAMADQPDVIITTYGDLIRVPGTGDSLQSARSRGRDIRIVYSTIDALKIAEDNPDKRTIFLGIGFETTSPASAAAVLEAERKNLENFFIYSSHKIMQPAMEILAQGEVNISAYLCPGHVSVITGTGIYERIAREFGIPCVAAGFEPVDILNALLLIVKQIHEGRSGVEIAYRRAVTKEGNVRAMEILTEVFEPADSDWRGIGIIPGSGLKLREKYRPFDAEKAVPVSVKPAREKTGCICGDILKGLKTPVDCPLFAGKCTPSTPVGACMVSSEGSCAAWYRYRR